MDLKAVFDQLTATIGSIPQSGLLIIAVAALVLGWLVAVLDQRESERGWAGRSPGATSSPVAC